MKDKALTLLVEHNFSELRQLLTSLNATDLAALLSEFPEGLLTVAFRVLPKELASETFVEMDAECKEHLIKGFSDLELKTVLDQLFIDDTVDIIEEMPASLVKRILKNSDKTKRDIINEVLKYPKNSAGSIMTTEYVSLRKDMTVEDAFTRIRRIGVNKETIYTCYVTDQSNILLGIVTAKDLMLASPDDLIEGIMETNIISSNTLDAAEDVAHLIEKYDFLAIPITDNEHRLVGIITFDDAMDVIKEETDDDFMKMAAVAPLEDSYFKTSVLVHARKRILWLLFLMVSATLTGIIITEYESVLSALLVSFIPMLMSTGGNGGSQSSAIIIRCLATEEIKLRDFGRVIFKELRIGLIAGVTLAIANAGRLWVLNEIYYHVPGGLGKEMIVVGIALVGAVVIAKMLGCVLPMFAKKIKLDPALFASPIITTLVDAIAVFLYFNIAVRVF